MTVRVHLGPVSAASARAWLAYAREILDALATRTIEGVTFDRGLTRDFAPYLEQWERAAANDPFEWTSVEGRAHVAGLATAWLDLMAQLSGRVAELGLPVGPPEGEAFYHALVAAIGDALAGGDEMLGEKLQEAWPALGEIAPHSDVTAPAGTESARPRTVVIADDSRDLRLVLRIALEQDGRFVVVGEASDGAEAVAVAAREQPDIVLLDLVMPGTDGWIALDQLRATCPDASVVVVSTLDEVTAERRALASGAAAYVQKSVSLANLTDALAAMAG